MLYSIPALATKGKIFRSNYNNYLTTTTLNMDLSAFIIPLNSDISANKFVTTVNGPATVTFSNNTAYFGDSGNTRVGFVINGAPNAGNWSWAAGGYTGTLDSPPTEFEGDFTMEVYISPTGLGSAGASWILNTKANATFGSTPGDYVFGINSSQLYFSNSSAILATINHGFTLPTSNINFKHVFIGRKNNVWWIGCDGVAISSSTQGNFDLSFTGPLQVGYHQFDGAVQFRGYMNSLIITKGSCKYFNSSYAPVTRNGLYVGFINGFYIAGLLKPDYTTFTPILPVDDILYYIVTSGAASLANGLYSNGYYTSGTRSTTYTNATPTVAVDNGKYYTAVNGTTTAVNGLYSNGYYTSGTRSTTYTNATPTVAVDNGKYYTAVNGTTTTANGLYSNGMFYTSGTRDTAYSTTSPTIAFDNGLYYTVANGTPTTANGLYSNGMFYTSGTRSTTYTNATPTVAVDNGKYYTVANGTSTAANGLYSNGMFYTSGTRSTTYSTTSPTVAVDNGKYYTVASGTPTAANGVYSNGYYISGTRQTTYTATEAKYAIDTQKFYSFSNGIATLANETIGDIPYIMGEVSFGARFQSSGVLTISNPGTDFNLGTGDFTIEAYVVVVEPGGFVFCTNTAANQGGYSIDFSKDYVPEGSLLVYRDNGGNSKLTQYNINYQRNTKFHLAVTRQSGTIKVWFNGSLVSAVAGGSGSSDGATNWNPSVGNVINIGGQHNSNGNNFWGGGGDTWMSDFRVTKGTARYTVTFTPAATLTNTTNVSILALKDPPSTTDYSTKGKILSKNGLVSP